MAMRHKALDFRILVSKLEAKSGNSEISSNTVVKIQSRVLSSEKSRAQKI